MLVVLFFGRLAADQSSSKPSGFSLSTSWIIWPTSSKYIIYQIIETDYLRERRDDEQFK
ncbi:hypothetical protein CASFOL_013549 [Castilleja foliolosa]|uniref:Uncharacterized protein n=1 Tax=Castilleja foliolosa TaxID=1961234 RepID=A0ABD3DLH7_9LAMI